MTGSKTVDEAVDEAMDESVDEVVDGADVPHMGTSKGTWECVRGTEALQEVTISEPAPPSQWFRLSCRKPRRRARQQRNYTPLGYLSSGFLLALTSTNSWPVVVSGG